MKTVKLYAELLANPKSLVAYRSLLDEYKNNNLDNEAKAIEELIQRKFDAYNTLAHKKQLENNTQGN